MYSEDILPTIYLKPPQSLWRLAGEHILFFSNRLTVRLLLSRLYKDISFDLRVQPVGFRMAFKRSFTQLFSK